MKRAKLNLINQKFHKLLVLSEVPAPSHRKDQNSTFYLCLCDCGNQSIVKGSTLITGSTKSCGCLKNARKYDPNLIGQIFGKLTVIEQVPNPRNVKSSFIYFKCQCECGKVTITDNYSLIYGHTKSCGTLCIKSAYKLYEDLTGQNFNNFYVIKKVNPPSHRKDQNGTFFLCRCICGTEMIIKGYPLTRGNPVSCGCLNKFAYPEEAKIATFEKYYLQYNDGDLSKEDFLLFTQLPCFYCGIEPYNKQNKHIYNKQSSQFAIENGWITTNGLDRISSAGTHTYDNIVPCCQTCNSFKLDLTYKDLIQFIPKLLDTFDIIPVDKLHYVKDQLKTIDLTKYSKNINPLTILFPIKINSIKRQSYISDIIWRWRNRERDNKFRKTSPLTDVQIAELLLAKCCYCGKETNINNRQLNQIDRLDNTLGYTIENSVTACKNCNSAKNTISVENFAIWVKRIKNNFHKLPKTEQEIKALLKSNYLFHQAQNLNIPNYYQIIKEKMNIK